MLVHHRLHIGAMGGAFPISRALSALKRHSFERPYPRPRLLADTTAVIGTTRTYLKALKTYLEALKTYLEALEHTTIIRLMKR